MDGVYREYPFLDAAGEPLWLQRFPDKASVELARKRAGDEIVWASEYLLKLVDRKDQLFKMEWIRRYDEMPHDNNYYLFTVIAVDPAVSEAESADSTAIVAGSVYRTDNNTCEIYIHPEIVNEKIRFRAMIDRLEHLSESLRKYPRAKILVEGVSSQDYIAQQLKADGYPAESVSIHGDKRERLAPAAAKMEIGKIFLPNDKRCDPLIWQLVGFGSEAHDDLADAFSLLVNYVLQYESEHRPVVFVPRQPVKTFFPYSNGGFPNGNKIKGYWV
jgi:predicted phage terminase large subunit-like protein